MIKSLMLAILLLISINHKEPASKIPEYILFVRTDENQNHSRPLYISTRKLNIQLDSFRYNMLKIQLKQLGAPMTKKIYEAFMNTQYAFVITDKKTYGALFDFIYKHPELYNPDTGGFNDYYSQINIHIDKKIFKLHNEDVDVFFKKMITLLKSKNYDRNVIHALGEI
jgi:hypothetical protein